jgi:hypothetical protein
LSFEVSDSRWTKKAISIQTKLLSHHENGLARKRRGLLLSSQKRISAENYTMLWRRSAYSGMQLTQLTEVSDLLMQI